MSTGDLIGVEPEELEEAMIEERGLSLLRNRKRLAGLLLALVLLVVAIYVVLPEVVGLDDALERFDDATWYWVLVALAFTGTAFVAYVMLFRGVVADGPERVRRRLDLRASYQITMAGLAATRIFSAAGAGGLVVTYWALSKAGMPRRRAACRMIAFLTLLYTTYLLALVLFGVLLRTGVLPGSAPLAGTVVPAVLAAAALAVTGLVALIPGDVERRLEGLARRYRSAQVAHRLAKGPATLATGVRTAFGYMRHPSTCALALGGAAGFWAANIGILWASFEAFGASVPIAVLVQGFFLGMAANLIPSPTGGVGAVDAGMIGAFLLFGIPGGAVFPAVLTYRVIAFWLPIPPGVVAFLQLRRTVARWEGERGHYALQSEVMTTEAT